MGMRLIKMNWMAEIASFDGRSGASTHDKWSAVAVLELEMSDTNGGMCICICRWVMCEARAHKPPFAVHEQQVLVLFL